MADWRDSIPSASSNQPSWKDSVPDATGIQSQPTVTDQHGRLYDAADKLLNDKAADIPTTGSGTMDSLNSFFSKAGHDPVDLAQGVAKGALSSAAGLGSIWNRFLPNHKTDFNQENLKGLTTANGAGQDVGKGAEQIGEFMLPTGEISGASKLAKAGNLGIDALKGAGIGGVQSGGDPTAITLNAALPFAGSALGSVVKPAAKALSEVLGFTTGATGKVLQRAFQEGPDSGLVKAMRQEPGYTPADVAKKLVDATEDLRDSNSKAYAQELNKLTSSATPFTNPNAMLQGQWGRKAQKFMGDIDDSLNSALKRFDAGSQGNLDLHRVPNDAGLRDGIQAVHDTVTNWGQKAEDLTPAGLDALKKNLSPYIKQGGRLAAFTKGIYDDASKGLESLLPGYSKMNDGYAKGIDQLDDIKNSLSAKANGESNEHAIVTKMGNLFKQPTDYRESVLNSMGPQGQEILSQIAGLHLKDVLPKGIIAKMMGGLELLHSGAWPALAGASPRLVGESAVKAGQASRAIQGFGNQGIGLAAKKTISPGLKAFISNSNNSTNYGQ